ncbi:hypothetical protein [Archangium violaceum]|uniref:hypothetical protein n=1 Tax=Archangium violaceum TaxID=83451 RepID=UPI00126A4CC3|nr:hypothetical protein [Archangium violaceum]
MNMNMNMSRNMKRLLYFAAMVIALRATVAVAQTLTPAQPGVDTPQPSSQPPEVAYSSALSPETLRVFVDRNPIEKTDCARDNATGTVTLKLHADGTQLCNLDELPQNYRAIVKVYTPYDWAHRCNLGAVEGKRLDAVMVRGSYADAKSAFSAASVPEDFVAPDFYLARTFGPFRSEDVTFSLECKEAKVDASLKFSVEPLYQVNVSAVALAGKSRQSFGISEGVITEATDSTPVDYFVGATVYPAAWRRINDQWTYGRYFVSDLRRFQDRIGVTAGFSLSSPRDQLFLGASVEVVTGLAVTVAWVPRRIERLTADSDGRQYQVGDAFEGTSAPTQKHWDFNSFGVGLAADATIMKSIIQLFK